MQKEIELLVVLSPVPTSGHGLCFLDNIYLVEMVFVSCVGQHLSHRNMQCQPPIVLLVNDDTVLTKIFNLIYKYFCFDVGIAYISSQNVFSFIKQPTNSGATQGA